MNNTYIIVAIAVIIAVIAIILLAYAPVQSLTLDQILVNKDCAGFNEWLNENIYDTALTPDQQKGVLNLALECDLNALDSITDQ